MARQQTSKQLKKPPAASTAAANGSRGAVAAAGVLIVLAGIAAYHNSFGCSFHLDDDVSISDNESIRHLMSPDVLVPPKGGATVAGRPLLNLTFAVNYAIAAKDGLDVTGYHVANLAIHLLAALVLFGIVRRTLARPRPAKINHNLPGPAGAAATGTLATPPELKLTPNAATAIAAAIALLWVAHPLATQAVTYISQRAESLAALFFLLTMYCVIRGASSPHTTRWHFAAVASCLAGMATKEIMVGAPLAVLAYDRLFLAGSFKEAMRRRWGLYVCMAASWGLLAALVLTNEMRGETAGATAQFAPDPVRYALTELGIIVHYLRLCFWPSNLCFDYGWTYGWPVADTPARIIPPALAVCSLLAATLWGLVRGKGWSILGVVFFLVLAPTSSILPIDDMVFEHRMYLPLAAVVAAAVLAVWRIVQRFGGRNPALSLAVAAVALAVAAATLAWRTQCRNRDYRSELALWRDTARKIPENPRARHNFGHAIMQQAQDTFDPALKKAKYLEALPELQKSLELYPDFKDAALNLGVTLQNLGDIERDPVTSASLKNQALQMYRRGLEMKSRTTESDINMLNNIGNLMREQGDYAGAVNCYRRILKVRNLYQTHNNLGRALLDMRLFPEAITECETAARMAPGVSTIRWSLAKAYAAANRREDAIHQYQEALRLLQEKPIFSECLDVNFELGNLLVEAGRPELAIRHYREVLRLDPSSTAARDNLQVARRMAGELP